MAKKRVHEIAKSQGMTSKEVLAKLQAAGLEVKAAASSVEEADALKVLGNGNGAAPAAEKPASPKAEASKPDGQAATPAAPAATTPQPTAPAKPAAAPGAPAAGGGGSA
jgi:translation initiation factor IF-2